MQTLCELHQEAKLAHLDLSLANIMLISEASNSWDKLRLLDFGLSEPFQPSGTAYQCAVCKSPAASASSTLARTTCSHLSAASHACMQTHSNALFVVQLVHLCLQVLAATVCMFPVVLCHGLHQRFCGLCLLDIQTLTALTTLTAQPLIYGLLAQCCTVC